MSLSAPSAWPRCLRPLVPVPCHRSRPSVRAATCASCACPAAWNAETSRPRLDSLMFSRRRIKAGQQLYGGGDRFESIYAVRSGSFKTSLELADGRDRSAASTWAAS